MMEQISTAEDFRRVANERALEPAELIALPSGLRVIVRRPTPLWFALNRGILPKSFTALAMNETAEETPVEQDELIIRAKFMTLLMETIVVEPRIRRNPAADEVDPALIVNEDFLFLARYAIGGGEIPEKDLETFPEESGLSIGSSDSRFMESAAESVAEKQYI